MNRIQFYIKQTAKEWNSHNPLLLGASISFYIILASGPVLTLLIMTAGAILGEQAAANKFVNEIYNVVGEKAAEMIRTIIQKASTADTRVTTIITSVPLMLFGSTMVFFQVKNALDSLWEGELKAETNMIKKLRQYLLAIAMLFITGLFFFLLMSKTIIISSADDFFPDTSLLSRVLNVLSTFTLVTLFFALVYKILIKYKMKWTHILTGAIVTSVLFSIVQVIVGINFSISNIESAYGAIGALTIWILWIFYSSLVFLFGASFLKIYSRKNGNNQY